MTNKAEGDSSLRLVKGSTVDRLAAQMRSWLKALTGRSRLEAEMEDELAFHLDALTDDLIRDGCAPDEAARRARIAIGAILTHKEEMRTSLGLRWWDELRADLRYGAHILCKNLGFTVVAAASLALAIGANTTIFSLAKSLIYNRLGVPNAQELRLMRWTADEHNVVHEMWGEFDSAPGGGMRGAVFSYPVYRQLRDHNQTMEDLLAFNEDSMNATVHGTAQRMVVAMVSGNYFAVLGVRPQLGRSLLASDDSGGSVPPVAVISDGLWERSFARSPSVLGQTITVNQSLFTVVGVSPRGFTGAKQVQSSPEVFVPISMQPIIDPKGEKGGLLDDSDLWWVDVIGRMKHGVSDAQADAALNVELAAAIRGTMTLKDGDTLPHLDLEDGSRGLGLAARAFKKPVYVLMVLTGFVLLLACANIANLLLARSGQRQHEMSVRLALGAGRGRVMRQLLTESLLLAGIGGAGGLLLAFLGRNVIPNLMTNAWDQNGLVVSWDWGVYGFATAVTLLTGVVFGLAPAWIAAHGELGNGLKESAQIASRRRKALGGKAAVAFQIALSTLLVVGAGLFLRTLFALNAIDLGFRTDHLILFEVAPPARRYALGKDVQLHQRLEAGFASLPGVDSVAPSSTAYIADNMNNDDFIPEGEEATGHHGAEDVNFVGTGFFQTMGISIVTGRSFGAQDTASSPKVAVVNLALARKRFPNQNPVGKRFRSDEDRKTWVQIVGVCADTRYANLRDPSPPQFFMPYIQQPRVLGLTYAIRTQLSTAELVPALRHVVQQADRDLPIIDIRTQQEQIDANMQMERTFAALTTGFGVLALTLACVGIYGIMAYSVAQRTNEIGVRMALGAQPTQIRKMILAESAWLVLAGIAVGVAVALALTRLVQSMLYEIQPWDPETLTLGILLLLAATMAATWIPAQRAAGTEPMEALRHD